MPLFKRSQSSKSNVAAPSPNTKAPPLPSPPPVKPPPPSAPLFSRIQLAAALIEYDDDDDEPDAARPPGTRKRAAESAILSPFLKKKTEVEEKQDDYFGPDAEVAMRDKRISTFRPNSMVSDFKFGGGSKVLDLPPMDGPGTPGSRTLDLPAFFENSGAGGVVNEEPQEEEELAKDYGLDEFMKNLSGGQTAKHHGVRAQERGRAKSEFDFQNFLKSAEAGSSNQQDEEERLETRSLPDVLNRGMSAGPSQLTIGETFESIDDELKAPPRIGRRFESFNFPRNPSSSRGQAAETGQLTPPDRPQSASPRIVPESIRRRPRSIHSMKSLDFSDSEAEGVVAKRKAREQERKEQEKKYSALDFERYRRGERPQGQPGTAGGEEEHHRAVSLDTGRREVMEELAAFRKRESSPDKERSSVLNRGRPKSSFEVSEDIEVLRREEGDGFTELDRIKAKIAALKGEITTTPLKDTESPSLRRARSRSLGSASVLDRPRPRSVFNEVSHSLSVPMGSVSTQPENNRASLLSRGRPKSVALDDLFVSVPARARTSSTGVVSPSAGTGSVLNRGRPKSVALDDFDPKIAASAGPLTTSFLTFPLGQPAAEENHDWFSDLKKERKDHDRNRAVSMNAMSMLNAGTTPSFLASRSVHKPVHSFSSSVMLRDLSSGSRKRTKSDIEPLTAEEAALPPSMAPRPVSRASLRANLEDDPERDNMTPDMKRLSYSSRLDPKHLEEMQREIEDRPRFKESLRPKILVLPEPLDPRYRVRKKIENGEDLDESDWVVIEEEMRLEEGEEAPTLMVERRPVGKLFGRSLMDDIERRHAVRKERNKLVQTPSRLFVSRTNSDQTGIAASLAPPGAGLATASDGGKRPGMTKTQSFFGPDVFLQKELEKLKLIEAQEQKEKKEEERKQQEKDSKKLRRKSKAMEKEVEGNGQKEDDDSDDDVPLGHFVPPTLSLPTVESLPQNMNSWFDADRDDQTSAHSHEKEDLRMQSDPRSPTPPIMPLSLSRPTHMATKSKAISVNSYQAFPGSNHGHASPALQTQQNRQYDRDESDSDDVPLAQVADKKRMTKATTSSQFLNIPALDDLSKDDDSLDDEVPLSMLPKKSTPKKPNSTRSVMPGQDSDDDEQPLAYRATQLALEGQRHPLTGGEDDDDVPLALKMAHGRSEEDDDVPLAMRQSNLNMVNAQAQAQALMMAQMQQNQHLSMMGMGMGGMGMGGMMMGGMGMGMGMGHPSMMPMSMSMPQMGMGFGGMAMPQPMPMAPNFMRMADDEDGGSMGMPEFNNPALNDTVNRWRNQVSTEEG